MREGQGVMTQHEKTQIQESPQQAELVDCGTIWIDLSNLTLARQGIIKLAPHVQIPNELYPHVPSSTRFAHIWYYNT